MTRRWLSLLGLVVLAGLFTPGLGQATQRLGVSPHQKADGCPACHDVTQGPAPGAVKPIEATCRGCHPDADMHPTLMKPKDVKVPDSFPLENGAVSCATCHAEPSCDASRPTVAPYLRGGNPDRKADFCYRCHEPLSKTRKSPHEPAEVAKTDGSCAACHNAIPKAGAAPQDAALRLKPELACTTCHPGTIHAGVSEHLGARLDHELTGSAAADLPLGRNLTVQCWTCHNVHKAGEPAPKALTGLAARIQGTERPPSTATDPKHDPMLALPVDDGSLCRACHGDGPK